MLMGNDKNMVRSGIYGRMALAMKDEPTISLLTENSDDNDECKRKTI